MYIPFFRNRFKTGLLALLLFPFSCFCLTACRSGSDQPWPWAGDTEDESAELLLLGDFNVQNRDNPADALIHVRATLDGADLVYANLEGLLVPSGGPARDIPGKSGWQHLGPEAVQALLAGNVRAVGLANNVAYGAENVMKSLSILDRNGIAHAGAGANLEQAHQPAIVESKGIRFGFLQYTGKWYEDHQIAGNDAPGVARILSEDGETVDPIDRDRMRDDIRRLRPQVDIVIVSSHTRDRQNRSGPSSRTAGPAPNPMPDQDLYSLLPVDRRLNEKEPYQEVLARAAIDAGADLVFGHGCHMLQAVDVYKGKPVMYCLGNFVSDWIRVRNYKDGMVARVVAQKDGIERVSLVPVTRDDANNVWMLDPSSGEGAGLFQQLENLSPGVPLAVEGREIVLIE